MPPPKLLPSSAGAARPRTSARAPPLPPTLPTAKAPPKVTGSARPVSKAKPLPSRPALLTARAAPSQPSDAVQPTPTDRPVPAAASSADGQDPRRHRQALPASPSEGQTPSTAASPVKGQASSYRRVGQACQRPGTTANVRSWLARNNGQVGSRHCRQTGLPTAKFHRRG
jgi:hypothetical protein